MRLLFKQRFFSWFDSYDIYDEDGNTVFTVEGKLAWGHCLHILNAAGEHIGTVQQRVLTFLPKFELYIGEQYYGCICKEFTFFTPRFTLECSDWEVNGSFMEWDYTIDSASRLYRDDHERAFSLDGHLRHRRRRPAGRAGRADGRAGHRRGKMQQEQLI